MQYRLTNSLQGCLNQIMRILSRLPWKNGHNEIQWVYFYLYGTPANKIWFAPKTAFKCLFLGNFLARLKNREHAGVLLVCLKLLATCTLICQAYQFRFKIN